MTRNRAKNLSSVRCCGALETWPRSQYSPRPPESALKKSPDLIPDQKANLSRPWTVPRQSPNHSQSTVFEQPSGSFLFFENLGTALAHSNKADRMDNFLPLQIKTPHQSVNLKKNVKPLLLGATE
ncbi:TPA: hypothetical protein SAN82_004186 [Pseudomonas putida]|nr:hypothetical protein [Pseudomonas putida]